MGDVGTESGDYGDSYYGDYAGGDYHGDSAHWSAFFGGVAAKIVRLFEPNTFLDAGCAKGLLVKAMVEHGVDAAGIDISEHAIANAEPSVRDLLAVGSLTSAIGRRFDVITCIEVLEHMSPADAECSLDNLVDATDLIVFSSTPRHYEDPTHINVRQPAEWSALFAERSFFRRFDIDLGFLSPWAVAYERRPLLPRDLVFAYENLQWPLRDEVNEKRQALLDKERLLAAETAKADGFDGLAAEAAHRQVVIDDLAAEAARRQVVIDDLAAEAARRQVVIDDLAAEAQHRQVVIDDLAAEAEHRQVVIDELAAEASRREATNEQTANDLEVLRVELIELKQRRDWKTVLARGRRD